MAEFTSNTLESWPAHLSPEPRTTASIRGPPNLPDRGGDGHNDRLLGHGRATAPADDEQRQRRSRSDDTDDPTKDFDWFEDIPLDDAYMFYDWDRPPKTCDLGCDGYTASLSDWHGLLQVTAPDESRGVVHIRGPYSDSPDSILARAQRPSQKDSWGLKFIEDDGVVLDTAGRQGLVNLRWPYVQYNLTKDGAPYVLCRLCSFVKDSVFYQVARVSAASTEDREYPVTRMSAVSTEDREYLVTGTTKKLKFGIGGLIRFGNSRTLGLIEPIQDEYTVGLSEDRFLLTCRSKRQEKLLRIRLFVNRAPAPLACAWKNRQIPARGLDTPGNLDDPGGQQFPHDSVDISSEHEIEFGSKPTVIVLAIALEDDPKPSTDAEAKAQVEKPAVVAATQEIESDVFADTTTKFGDNKIDQFMAENVSEVVRTYLGIDDAALHAPYRLWRNRLLDDDGTPDIYLSNVIGKAIEYVMCVSSVPITIRYNQLENPTRSIGEEESIQDQTVDHGTPLADGTLPAAMIGWHVQDRKTQIFGGTDGTTPIALTVSALDDPKEEGLDEKIYPPQKGVALLQNIMTGHLVEWKNTFSQVRLLVKSYCYLKIQAALQPLQEQNTFEQPLAEMDRLYRSRLLDHIQGVLLWIMVTGPSLSQRTEVSTPGVVMADSGVDEIFFERNHSWNVKAMLYPAIIVMYVIKHIPELVVPVVTNALWTSLESSRWDVSGSWLKPGEETKSFLLLRWYNFAALAQLARLLQKDDELRLQNTAWLNVKELDEKANLWKTKSERSLRPADKGRSNSPLVDYQTVNLILLAQELVSSAPGPQQPNSSVTWLRKVIQSREATAILNPGQKAKFKQETNSAPSTSAPWELDCLNHLSALRVATDDLDIEAADQNCRKFLFSDFSFMSSWNHSFSGVVAGCWDPSTACDIAAALLDNIMEDDPIVSTITGDPLPKPPKETVSSTGAHDVETESKPSFETILRQNTVTVKDPTLDDFARRQLAVSERILSTLMRSSEFAEEFDWTAWQPRMAYHPDMFYQSLDDTPEKFQAKQTHNVDLRSNIKKYFRRKNNDNDMDPPNWTLADIGKKLKPEDLLYISCFDLGLEPSADSDVPGDIFVLSQKGRADKSFQQLLLDMVVAPGERGPLISNEPAKKGVNGRQTPSFWSLYLNGHPELHPSFKGMSKEMKQIYTDTKQLKIIRDEYQKALLTVLVDSLIDLGTKYRILFAHRTTPTIVQAFIYMLHMDSLDTFDDYFGPVSSFFNTPSGPTDEWITSITISYWGLVRNNEGLSKEFDEARGDKAAFPPKSISGTMKMLRRAFSKIETKANDVEICLLSTSVVFSGPELGNYWTCSVISSLVDELSIQDIINREVTEILQMFIHQPSSARCLAFLLLLGHVCENLARECETFTHSLDDIMGMGQTVLLTGIEWEKSEVALRKLKKMLWCLEALRNFDDKLASAISEIKEGRKQMQHQLSKSPGQRHKDLSRFAEGILEDFDKRAGRLEDAHSNILQRIDQSTRLREGITSVLGVEQNENIGMLTYITLAYLPLGFIAALFSAGHNVIPDSFGSATFSWLTVIFFVGTFAFALSLQTILGTSHKIYKAIDKQAEAWDHRQVAREREKRAQRDKEAVAEEDRWADGRNGWTSALTRRNGKGSRSDVFVAAEEARIANGRVDRNMREENEFVRDLS